MTTQSNDSLTRRDFLRTTAAAGLALGAVNLSGCARLSHGEPASFTAEPIDTVRMGFVGVGGMGSVHLQNYLHIPNVEIRAICDIDEGNLKRAQDLVEQAGQPRPEGYSRGDHDFLRLCERDDLDYILTATPWRWHVPVCVAAMEAGKHAATEVPAAMDVDDCWRLIETSEKTCRYCVMLENCCYDRRELSILNMVRQGALGEIVHAECGYEHDLRELKFSSGGEGLWRLDETAKRNGNLYPTHGLGPIAWCMDINRGDRFDYLVSMSSPSRGLQAYAAEHYGANDPRATRKYACGDVNSTLIKTKKGLTILVKHDCNLPRPYDRINMVQGTGGIVRGYPDEVHFDGKGHEWEPLENYYGQYDHPLWKAMEDKFPGFGHGGMDYIEDYRMIRALRKGIKPDLDVYDAAAWSCLVGLTEQSVTHGSRPVDVPDFTRGQWKTRPRLELDFS